MLKKGNFTGNDKFEGFTIDLLKCLAEKLQMTYRIYRSPGNMYGTEVRPGKWNGMVEEVLVGVCMERYGGRGYCKNTYGTVICTEWRSDLGNGTVWWKRL